MKRFLFSIVYWMVAIIILSLVLLSTKYSFGQALLISCSLLPGTLLAKYLAKGLSFKNRNEGIRNSIYIAFAALITIYLCIILIHWYLLETDATNILMNPLFIFIIVSLFTGINYWFETRLFNMQKNATEKYIVFISDRKKIKLALDNIVYIESNDNEVWIRTSIDSSYRTKMKISRWEEILDKQFIRIHRSYIINSKYILSYDSTSVIINTGIQNKKFEISRKYRDAANYAISTRK